MSDDQYLNYKSILKSKAKILNGSANKTSIFLSSICLLCKDWVFFYTLITQNIIAISKRDKRVVHNNLLGITKITYTQRKNICLKSII